LTVLGTIGLSVADQWFVGMRALKPIAHEPTNQGQHQFLIYSSRLLVQQGIIEEVIINQNEYGVVDKAGFTVTSLEEHTCQLCQ
jgi:hypothetical protein